MKKDSDMVKTILFISGAFLGNNCWDGWRRYFEEKGYSTVAPPWPHKDAPPEDLRNRDSQSSLALLDLTALTDHFAAIIQGMSRPPVLIGHSVGGLVVQLLLQRGLGSAGVALHPFPPRAGKIGLSFLVKWWKALDYFSPDETTYLIPYAKWRFEITNGFEEEKQKHFYYEYVTPESRLLLRELVSSEAGKSFTPRHVPLLITSGKLDRMSPAAVIYRKMRRLIEDDPRIDYKVFKGLNHLIFGDSEAMEVAEFVHTWLLSTNQAID